MFRKEKSEQNENILCLKGIRKFWIMFTIFKFQMKREYPIKGSPWENV